MRFLMTAAFVGLSTMSAAFFVAANSDAHAQKSKASSSAPSAVHGMARPRPLPGRFSNVRRNGNARLSGPV